MDNTDRTQK